MAYVSVHCIGYCRESVDGDAARADTYPSKTITIVVGFAPGGLIDVIARLVGQKLQGKLGQTVIVENRAGAAGNLAHRRVAAAEPDGYTILGATTSLPINETLYPKRGYTADDFKAISIAVTSPEMISAPPSGAKTLKEFVDMHARRRRNSGPPALAAPLTS